MNYLEIVLQGYFNENNRGFLDNYFFMEYKKAEKEQFFKADMFFNGCLKVIEGWEKYLQDEIFKRKTDLYLMLNEARNGTLSYSDMEGKTIEQKRQETIEYCEQELKDVRPDGIGSLSFKVHLSSLTTGRIAYNMAYNEVLQIKLSILRAFQKTQTNVDEPEKSELPTHHLGNNTKDKIESHFSFMLKNDLRKHKQILTEPDYNKLIDWLTLYFENRFTIPKITEPIRTVNTAKGNVIFSFKAYYKDEFSGSNFPDSLFELIKSCFYQYRNDNIENMKKTKEPDNYKELIKQRK